MRSEAGREASLGRYPYVREQVAALREIARTSRSRGAPVLMALVGPPDLERHLSREIGELATVSELSLPTWVDPSSIRNSVTDAHWNRTGNLLFADAIATDLIDLLQSDER
jgi:hypothetical protein